MDAYSGGSPNQRASRQGRRTVSPPESPANVYQSISVKSDSNLKVRGNDRSKSSLSRSHGRGSGSQDARGTTIDRNSSSLEIVNIAVKSQTHVKPKFTPTGPEAQRALMTRTLESTIGQNIDLKQEVKLTENRLKEDENLMLVIDQEGGAEKVIFESDKLLEPSQELMQSDPAPIVQRRKTNTKRAAALAKQRQKKFEIAAHLEQAQYLGCKCEICKLHLNQLKHEGYDPRIKDLVLHKERQDKFLQKQVVCDGKMRELYQEINQHVQEVKKAQNDGTQSLQEGIKKEMVRIAEINKMSFRRGDHFVYEHQDFNWLLQKLAGTEENPYMGCPIKVTETVLFNNGKPSRVIKTTLDDGCLNQIKGSMTLLELKKHLRNLFNDRSKDYQRKLQQIKFEQQALMKKQALERAQQKQMMAASSSQRKGNQSDRQSQQNEMFSARSRTNNKSTLSVNSSVERNQPISTANQESSFDTKTKRDAFLLRFKKSLDGENGDRVINDSQLFAELDKKASDKYWQEIQSISITPNAKTGLGQLITFTFVAPCFERGKPKDRQEQLKLQHMSFYGEVRFDFKQFGNDDATLKAKQPVQFCQKMCHIMGFYLKHVHGFDMMQVKVDFYQDEFGEIWLMAIDKLMVRKNREVPTDHGTQLADFVLNHMEDMAAKERQEKIKKEKELASLMQEDTESPTHRLNQQSSLTKRAKSIALEQSHFTSNGAGFGSTRRKTVSPSNLGQSTQSTHIEQTPSFQDKFRQLHPQYFASDMIGQSDDPSFEDSQQLYSRMEGNSQQRPHAISKTSKLQSGSVTFAEANDSQLSKSSYLNDADNVHRINQLKELRLSLNKLRNGSDLINTSLRASDADQQLPPRLSIDPQPASSYIQFNQADRNFESNPVADYDMRVAQTTVSRTQIQRQSQKSLRHIEKLIGEANRVSRDCNEFDHSMNRKTLQGMRTTCPLLKQENVIQNVQKAAKNHQNYRKSLFFQMKSFNAGQNRGLSNGEKQQKSRQSYQQLSQKNLMNQRAGTTASSGFRNTRREGTFRNSNAKNSNSMRDSVTFKEQSENPFQTGEALEEFEQKAAKKNIMELDDSSVIMFNGDDFKNPKVRDFQNLQKQSQRWKRVLFDQQVQLQKRCDALNPASIETNSSAEDRPPKEHPSLKYKRMEQDFEKQQRDENLKFLKDYRVSVTAMQQEAELLASQKVKKLQSSEYMHTESITDIQNVQQEAPTLQDHALTAENDNPLPIVHAESMPMSTRQDSVSPPVVADVVTDLSREDFTGMPHIKARQLAQLIINNKQREQQQRDSKMSVRASSTHEYTGTSTNRLAGRSIRVSRRHTNMIEPFTGKATPQDPTGDEALSSNRYGAKFMPTGRSTSTKPQSTAANPQWQYEGDMNVKPQRQQQSQNRALKPMTNQKARALVQQDYFLTRQGNSHKQLTSEGIRQRLSYAPTAAASALNFVQPNPISQNIRKSYEPGQHIRNSGANLAVHQSSFNDSKASNAVNLQNLSGISPFHKMHIIAGSKPSVTNAGGGGVKSTLTTHYGTFGALSASGHNVNHTGSEEDMSHSLRQSLGSAGGQTKSTHVPLQQFNRLVKAYQGNKNASVLRNLQNQSQLTTGNVQVPPNSFLNQQSSSDSLQVHRQLYLQQPPSRGRGIYGGASTKTGKYAQNVERASFFFQRQNE